MPIAVLAETLTSQKSEAEADLERFEADVRGVREKCGGGGDEGGESGAVRGGPGKDVRSARGKCGGWHEVHGVRDGGTRFEEGEVEVYEGKKEMRCLDEMLDMGI